MSYTWKNSVHMNNIKYHFKIALSSRQAIIEFRYNRFEGGGGGGEGDLSQ